jgi:hypothetical protein
MNESFRARLEPTDECFGLKRYRRDEDRSYRRSPLPSLAPHRPRLRVMLHPRCSASPFLRAEA